MKIRQPVYKLSILIFCPLETIQIVGFVMHDINRHTNNYENN